MSRRYPEQILFADASYRMQSTRKQANLCLFVRSKSCNSSSGSALETSVTRGYAYIHHAAYSPYMYTVKRYNVVLMLNVDYINSQIYWFQNRQFKCFNRQYWKFGNVDSVIGSLEYIYHAGPNCITWFAFYYSTVHKISALTAQVYDFVTIEN